MNTVHYQNWGLIEYGEAFAKQESIMQKGLDIKSKTFATTDSQELMEPIENHLIVCTHPHVYTLGKSGAMENLLVNNNYLKELGATFYKTNRGGDITYHGPGQLVAYPILDLEQFTTDLGKYMRNLEEVIIRTIAQYGIVGERLQGATGVWLDTDIPGKARKICAMGVRSSRWITMHGLALNMNTDLNFFNLIVPCGISDKGVTSIAKELGNPVDESEVLAHFLEKFKEVFEVAID